MRQYLLRFFSSSRQMAADAYSSMASLTRTLCCTFGFLPYWSYSSDGRPIKVANSFVASVSGSNMVWPILLVSLPSHAATGGFEGEGGDPVHEILIFACFRGPAPCVFVA